MAWKNHPNPVTLTASTGITQYRFVTASATGVAYPTAGAAALGVTVSSGTTGSTADNRSVSVVMPGGIVKVSAPASTLSKGDAVTASSRGQAVPSSAGDYVNGYVVDGTSGGAGRLLSIALVPVGTT